MVFVVETKADKRETTVHGWQCRYRVVLAGRGNSNDADVGQSHGGLNRSKHCLHHFSEFAFAAVHRKSSFLVGIFWSVFNRLLELPVRYDAQSGEGISVRATVVVHILKPDSISKPTGLSHRKSI